jgi:hypothetical protein
MKIKYTDVDEIASIAGLDQDAIHSNYSGRGMYGAECIGFVIDGSIGSAAMRLGIALNIVLGEEKATDLVDRVKSDNMGLGTILYFPGVKIA